MPNVDAKSDSKSKSTKQVANDLVAAASSGDVEAIVALWEPGGVERIHGVTELTAPEGQRQWYEALFTAFTGFSFEAIQTVVSRETAVVRWRATGTFDGDGSFLGLHPTAAEAGIEGVTILTVRDGLAINAEVYLNMAELSRQLGAMPPAGSLGERAVITAANAKTAAVGLVGRLREMV